MIKMISPVLHTVNFADGVGWGHAVNDCGPDYPVKFKEIETYGYEIDIFYPLPVGPGDIILRRMASGKIGAFECQKGFGRVDYSRQTPFGPKDNYKGKVIFCGYYNKTTGQVEVFSGYGI